MLSNYQFKDAWANFLPLLFRFYIISWRTSHAAINELVNAPSEVEQAERIYRWKMAMFTQLGNTGLMGTLMSAVVAGGFSWPSLPTLSRIPYTIVHVTWYCSLIFAVAAVAIGLAQSVFLARVGSLINSDAIFVRMLSLPGKDGHRVPRWHQVFIWQLSVGLLEWSIYIWLNGLVVFIWCSTRLGNDDQTLEDRVIAGISFVAALTSLFLFLFSTLHLWSSVSTCEDLLLQRE